MDSLASPIRATTLLLALTASLSAQTSYRLPPKEIVDIVDAPPPPRVSVSPRRDAMLLVDYEAHPPIVWLARPFHRLAGVRIDAELGVRQRIVRNTGITILRFSDRKKIPVELPPSARIGFPSWSYDGSRFAFTRDTDDGAELWIADAATGKASPIPGVRLNDVLASPFQWMRDSTALLVRLIPAGRGKAPEAPRVPSGPVIEETAGKLAKPPTFQDLLRNSYDEQLFEHYATTQLAVVNARSGGVAPLGKPDLFLGAEFSPDGNYLLLTRLQHPFSYRVPYYYFARIVEILDPKGNTISVIARLPIADDVPTQGVPKGPRAVRWQALHPSTLLWTEALDGGDPLKKAPHRDAIFTLAAPYMENPKEVMRIQHRFTGFSWMPKRDEVLLNEYDRDRRWQTTALVDLTRPAASRRVLFDLSVNDAYGDPGWPLTETRLDGQTLVIQDGPAIYLSGEGATPQGNRPFLDRFDVTTLTKERLFQSADGSLESVVDFADDSRTRVLLQHESKTEPPNYFLFDLKNSHRLVLTDFKDPAPLLTRMKKELLKCKRPDGVELSGMLYLPADHRPGTRLPVLVWAYPLEYSDPGTAGQVRDSPHSFTFYRGTSPLFFLTQGYAVLMDATMPVIGDPETMNDTYVEQIVSAAKAAVDQLVAMGVADANRILVAGHSYGGFMTANLLAHSDLFAAGIARSGAYNRTLTPFGFQAERRSFWEAKEVYMKLSPFMHANKVNEPILLIHGDADNNPGTHTIQSERFYQAIRGSGGTARLVLLPHESHGYVARESVLLVLAEMLDWADKHVKNRPSTTSSSSSSSEPR